MFEIRTIHKEKPISLLSDFQSPIGRGTNSTEPKPQKPLNKINARKQSPGLV